jgi:hypothetical protein
MVHALREAWRVLRPGGLLIDLRPAPQHRRVSVRRAAADELVGVMRERFDRDHDANHAVAAVSGPGGPLRLEGRAFIPCERQMDSAADFDDWLRDFAERDPDLPSHAWLLARAGRALAGPGRAKLIVAGPLELRALRKRVNRKDAKTRRG